MLARTRDRAPLRGGGGPEPRRVARSTATLRRDWLAAAVNPAGLPVREEAHRLSDMSPLEDQHGQPLDRPDVVGLLAQNLAVQALGFGRPAFEVQGLSYDGRIVRRHLLLSGVSRPYQNIRTRMSVDDGRPNPGGGPWASGLVLPPWILYPRRLRGQWQERDPGGPATIPSERVIGRLPDPTINNDLRSAASGVWITPSIHRAASIKWPGRRRRWGFLDPMAAVADSTRRSLHLTQGRPSILVGLNDPPWSGTNRR